MEADKSKYKAANDNELMPRREFSIEMIEMLHKLGVEPARTNQVMKRLFYYMDIVDNPNANKEGYIYESLDELLSQLLYFFNMHKEQGDIVSDEFKQAVKQTVSAIIAVELPEKDNVINIDFKNGK